MSSFEQQNNSNVNLSIDHQLIEEGGLYISHLLLKELLGSIYTKLCCIERWDWHMQRFVRNKRLVCVCASLTRWPLRASAEHTLSNFATQVYVRLELLLATDTITQPNTHYRFSYYFPHKALPSKRTQVSLCPEVKLHYAYKKTRIPKYEQNSHLTRACPENSELCVQLWSTSLHTYKK